MKKTYCIFLIIISFLISNCHNKKEESIILPKKPIMDEYFGQNIIDPYRYMENSEDSIVNKWYLQEKNNAIQVLSQIKGRNTLKEKIDKYSNVKLETITKLRVTSNNLYFYLKNTPGKNVGKLHYRVGVKGSEILLFDPTGFKPENKSKYSINYIKPNWDGSYILISLTKNDEEISEVIIFDVKNLELLNIMIDHCWPSGLGGVHWLPDNKSFTYEHIPVIDKRSKDYILNTSTVLYSIGNDPKNLNVLFSKKNNPEIPFKAEDFPEVDVQNQNDDFMFAGIWGPEPYADYFYSDIENLNHINKKINWIKLFSQKDKIKDFKLNGSDIIFLTSKNATNFKICKTSLSNPDFDNPITLVKEDSKAVITDFTITQNGLFYVKNKNGVDAKLYRLIDNEEHKVAIPMNAGNIRLSTKGINYSDLWIEIEGWTYKRNRFKYNYDEDHFVEENIYPNYNYASLKDVIIKEIEIESHDGEMVPLSIIHKKGIKLDGENRLFLSGYGAYGVSDSPKLEPYLPYWLEEGGIYAIAHVRGGGEKGYKWYIGGKKTTKPNTWKDFIACTKYLINKKYTSPPYISVFSGSAGGILIGRAITERPDLYSSAVIRVGVLNTLRTETGPNGLNNTKEFGTVKDSTEFKALLEMDSYHHIKKGVKYPALFLTAGMKDARVNEWESGKFVARMRELNESEKPVLLSVDFEGGHGIDAGSDKKNMELIDIISFSLWQTGHPDYQLKN